MTTQIATVMLLQPSVGIIVVLKINFNFDDGDLIANSNEI